MCDDAPPVQSTGLIQCVAQLQLAAFTIASTTYGLHTSPFSIERLRANLAAIRANVDNAEQAALRFVCEVTQVEGRA